MTSLLGRFLSPVSSFQLQIIQPVVISDTEETTKQCQILARALIEEMRKSLITLEW